MCLSCLTGVRHSFRMSHVRALQLFSIVRGYCLLVRRQLSEDFIPSLACGEQRT